MAHSEPATVVILNYHEVTADPRVLKQARALSDNGYRVHVYCAEGDGLPAQDVIGDIQVTRFACFSGEGLREDDADKFAFLKHSGPLLFERFRPYARLCEKASIAAATVKQTCPDLYSRAQKDHYNKHRGLKRIGRKLSYTLAKLRFERRLAMELKNAGFEGLNTKGLKIASKTLRAYRKALFQAQALVFAVNLMELQFPENVSVVHAHDIYCLPAGVLLKMKTGAHLIYDAHEYEPERATKMAPNGPNLAEALERDCFPYLSRMITVSESIAKLYEARLSIERPVVIMNAPETWVEQRELGGAPDEVSIRKNAGLDPDVPVVVFTGGVQRGHRGVDKVLEALKYLPDVFLVSLGPRHPANDAWLTGYAKSLGVSDRLRMLPPVDARDVPRAISSATLAICPFQNVSLNHKFAMPNKLFEAAFAGIPICVSNLPEMRRFVEEIGIGRAMDETDPVDIAAAIRDVIENRERYLLTPQSASRLEAIYSWKAQTAKLLALYESVLTEQETISASQSGVRASRP